MGRPPGSGSGSKSKGKMQTLSKAKPPESPPPGYEVEEYWKCPRCGHKYTKQKGSFYVLQSPIYTHNNGFATICISCVKELYVEYVKKFNGDEDMAMECICALLDVPVFDNMWESARFNGDGLERVSRYITHASAKRSSGNVIYSDSFLQRKEEEKKAAEERLMPENAEAEAEAVRRFGGGFEPSDYGFLMTEYADWVKRYGDPVDKVHEEMYTTLCLLKLNLQSGIQHSVNNVSALAKSYKDYMESTISLIEQRKKELEPEVRHDPLGVMIRDIENYTPAEFYKDKSLYNDEDDMGEYLERFVLRPLKNLLTGSRIMDEEFSIVEYQDDGAK